MSSSQHPHCLSPSTCATRTPAPQSGSGQSSSPFTLGASATAAAGVVAPPPPPAGPGRDPSHIAIGNVALQLASPRSATPPPHAAAPMPVPHTAATSTGQGTVGLTTTVPAIACSPNAARTVSAAIVSPSTMRSVSAASSTPHEAHNTPSQCTHWRPSRPTRRVHAAHRALPTSVSQTCCAIPDPHFGQNTCAGGPGLLASPTRTPA